MRKIRIFVKNDKLTKSSIIKLEGNEFDYLTKVMRQKIQDKIFVFNGLDGDFKATISSIDKKSLSLTVDEKIAELKKVPNITLAFAPTKNVRIDFVAAKATELGAARFQPIITQHTIVDKINYERFSANVKEALEQCERNDSAEVLEAKKLDNFLNNEETAEKILILCDESGKGLQAKELLPKLKINNKEIVILIGPEGGFSKDEFAKMHLLKNLYSLNLGPRILRADTAMISALTLVQEFLGDFNLKP
jgi:16S rRNA (uracil1498-N3)-methyltransferase